MSEHETRSDGDGFTSILLLCLLLLLVLGGGGAFFFYRVQNVRMAEEQALAEALRADVEAVRASEATAKLERVDRQQERVQGVWKAEFQIEPGTKDLDVPGHPAFHNRQIELKGNRWSYTERPRGLNQVLAREDWSFQLDPTQKTIDLFDDKGNVQRQGIYEWEGDSLKVCLGSIGKSRPTEFKSDAKQGWVYNILRPQKP